MDVAAIRMLFSYHYGLFDQVWDYVMTLTAEQFAAENDYSLRSVRNHLVHCVNVDDRWLARLQGRIPPQRLVAADHPDQRVARYEWDGVRDRVFAYLAGLTEGDIQASLDVGLPDRFPAPRRFARWQILLHMVNHGTDHREQILARLHELGAPTTEQDLVLYLWNVESETT